MSHLVTDLFALPFRTTAYGMNLMARSLQEMQKWLDESLDCLDPKHPVLTKLCPASTPEPAPKPCPTPTPDPTPVQGLWPIANVPPVAQKMSFEETVLIVYCVGRGIFSNENPPQFINLQMDMFDFHGRWIGYQYGVHRSLATPQELFAVPAPPAGGYQNPTTPIPKLRTNEWTKGVWTFEDGSEIFAAGPAFSHLAPFNDGSNLFMVTTGQTITSGSGRFKGVAGVKQATGTAFVPPGLLESGKFPAPGMVFQARTIETFRFMLAKDYTSLAPAGPPQPETCHFPTELLSKSLADKRAAARKRASKTGAAKAAADKKNPAKKSPTDKGQA